MQPQIMAGEMEICFIGLHWSPDHNSREVLWAVITEEGRAQHVYEWIEI